MRRRIPTAKTHIAKEAVASRWGMVHTEDGSQVGPGNDFQPAAAPPSTKIEGGGRTGNYPWEGADFLPAQVAQAPRAAVQHHPGRFWVKVHVHTSAA